ncbi:hypothetical protein LINPERHAP1_LOCUS38863, partial [Linum perenne]
RKGEISHGACSRKEGREGVVVCSYCWFMFFPPLFISVINSSAVRERNYGEE